MKGLLVCVIKYLKIHDFCHRIKNKDGNEICNSKIVHGFLTVPSTVFRMHTHVVTKQYMSEPCDKLVGLPDAEDSWGINFDKTWNKFYLRGQLSY